MRVSLWLLLAAVFACIATQASSSSLPSDIDLFDATEDETPEEFHVSQLIDEEHTNDPNVYFSFGDEHLIPEVMQSNLDVARDFGLDGSFDAEDQQHEAEEDVDWDGPSEFDNLE